MQTFARWVRRFADWLAPSISATSPYIAIAKTLIDQAEARLGAGFGDAKRRDVYARLMKEFPEARKRDLAFVIEQVLQDRP